eukprot:3722372-Pyramimonas_sp.AAC.1
MEFNWAASGQSWVPAAPSCGTLAAFLGCSALHVSRLGSFLRPSSGRRGGAWVRRGSRGPTGPSWIPSPVFEGCLGALRGLSC